ncbi:MAG TPA: rRNA maturation RNase YbeY [Bacteroidales bacterium]|nr:rRNA maturation RNase YbeY [Bacteroidales bacterium]
MSIKIFYDELVFRLKRSGKAKKIVREIITKENRIAGDLSFIITNDERLKEINIEFLEHDYYTDVITFNYNEKDIINGEIYISLDRIKENALNYNVSLEAELLRVLIHGVLHLVGYDDSNEEKRSEMRRMEDYWLNSLKEQDYGFSI